MAYQNQPEHVYATIDDKKKNEPKVHEYEHLQRGKNITERVPERLQMASPEQTRPEKRSCRRPPWWGWLIIVLVAVLLCVMVTLLVLFLQRKYSTTNIIINHVSLKYFKTLKITVFVEV